MSQVVYPNIEAERGRLGMDKTEFSKMIGVTRMTYANWQSGKSKIPVDVIVDLSKRLHVSTNYLLGLEG